MKVPGLGSRIGNSTEQRHSNIILLLAEGPPRNETIVFLNIGNITFYSFWILKQRVVYGLGFNPSLIHGQAEICRPLCFQRDARRGISLPQLWDPYAPLRTLTKIILVISSWVLDKKWFGIQG